MSNPPQDRSEFWIRFICASLFFGLILGIGILLRSADSWGIPLSFTVWFISTFAIAMYAARIGDEAWKKLLELFRWWW